MRLFNSGPTITSTSVEQVEIYRQSTNEAAIIFLHGFSGSNTSWGEFPTFLTNEPRLRRWDVFGVTYTTSKSADVPFWKADPDLTTLAVNLRTTLSSMPLNKYSAITLLAHSMGGLVAQQAMLTPDVERRVEHLFLFGTPSLGFHKPDLLGLVKRQTRDMRPGSIFIKRLRAKWTEKFGNGHTFNLSAIAGDRDTFVPRNSIFGPFSDHETKVVPGDHVTMALPPSASALAVRVVTEGLLGNGLLRDAADSAEIALERRQFDGLVRRYYPNSQPLEPAIAVTVALALDALGRGDEAIALLENQTGLDAMGTLGGRYKRKWLLEGADADWRRSRELYSCAYALAVKKPDHEQAMYHAINIAFLDAMQAPKASAVPEASRTLATEARMYAQNSKQDHWNAATMGEADLIIGNLESAKQHYQVAKERSPGPRDIGSIYSQASHLATHLYGDKGRKAIRETFDMIDP